VRNVPTIVHPLSTLNLGKLAPSQVRAHGASEDVISKLRFFEGQPIFAIAIIPLLTKLSTDGRVEFDPYDLQGRSSGIVAGTRVLGDNSITSAFDESVSQRHIGCSSATNLVPSSISKSFKRSALPRHGDLFLDEQYNFRHGEPDVRRD
jgi:hypothetical protein